MKYFQTKINTHINKILKTACKEQSALLELGMGTMLSFYKLSDNDHAILFILDTRLIKEFSTNIHSTRK